MIRRLSGVAVVASLAALMSLAATATPAQAFSGGSGSALTDPANAEKVKTILRTIQTDPAATAGTTAAQVTEGMTYARSAAALLPQAAMVASVIVVGGYTGWKIGSPAGGYIYKRLTGDTYGGTPPSGTTQWMSVCSTAYQTANNVTCGANSISVTGFDLAGTATSGSSWTGPGYYLKNTTWGERYCSPAGLSGCTRDTTWSTQALAFESAATGRMVEQYAAAAACGTSGGYTLSGCHVFLRNPAQMKANIRVDTDTSAGYAAAANKIDNGSWTVPDTTTSDQLSAALQALGAFDTTTGTAAQEAAIKAINAQLADTPLEVGTITLPDPEPDETVNEYLARLRALGWLGTATVTAYAGETSGYADYDPRYGPDTPVRIKLGSTGTWRYLPAPAWAGSPSISEATWPDPTNPPKVEKNGNVYITKNPLLDSGSVAVPSVGGGGDCDGYLTADFDLSPIMDIDYGDKFPFGVFPWAADQWDIFDVTAVAPAWTIPVMGPDSWTADYEIDLEPFSPYMSTMRTVLAWVLWVGSLWYLATTFLGIRSTGNPADAVDDYLDQVI